MTEKSHKMLDNFCHCLNTYFQILSESVTVTEVRYCYRADLVANCRGSQKTNSTVHIISTLVVAARSP